MLYTHLMERELTFCSHLAISSTPLCPLAAPSSSISTTAFVQLLGFSLTSPGLPSHNQPLPPRMAARRLGHADWRNVRPRSAGRDVPRVEAVDFFRHFDAAEHAGRRVVSSKRHGDFLGERERGKGRKRRLARTRGDSAGLSVLESGRRWKYTLVLLRQPSIPRLSKFQVPQQALVIV